MPIIKSAKKRVRTTRKATVRNVKTKRSLKTALKAFHSAVTGTNHKNAQSALDKAAKKKVLHKNKVARKQRQLSAKAKAAGAKSTKSVKKTVAKKPVAKKTPAKKTAPKKTITNKTTKK